MRLIGVCLVWKAKKKTDGLFLGRSHDRINAKCRSVSMSDLIPKAVILTKILNSYNLNAISPEVKNTELALGQQMENYLEL